MENLEEDTQESIATTMAATNTALDLTTTSIVSLPIMEDLSSLVQENIDDSVILIHPHIDMVDLTSPTQPQQPSASTSAGAGSSISSTLLGPLTFEEPSCSKDALKDSTCLTASSAAENLTSSTSGSAVASSSDVGTASVAATATNILECPICLQTCIHPARLPCGHIFCFLCVKGVAYKNRRCAMCRREIPPEFLDHPQLVNGIEDICTTKATDDGYQWFYEGRNGGWWAYDKRTAIEIEEVFQYLHNKTQTQTQEEEEEEEKEKVEQIKKQDVNPTKDFQNKENDDYNDEDDDDNDEEEDFDNIQLPAIDNSNYTYRTQICGSMYILDFIRMVQYPENMPHRRRKICRAKGLPAKGVAGLMGSSSRRRGWGYRRYRPYY